GGGEEVGDHAAVGAAHEERVRTLPRGELGERLTVGGKAFLSELQDASDQLLQPAALLGVRGVGALNAFEAPMRARFAAGVCPLASWAALPDGQQAGVHPGPSLR